MKSLTIEPESELPDWPFDSPYRAILVVGEDVPVIWQKTVSEWLVETGCMYVIPWGYNYKTWADSIHMASTKALDSSKAPESEMVIDTGFEFVALLDTYKFLEKEAVHPSDVELQPVIIIAASSR